MGCVKGQWGESGWIDQSDMPKVLAKGAVTLNLSAGYDEEGITAKPFEIAASGVAMLHNEATGLGEFFEPGKEVLTFATPRQARRKSSKSASGTPQSDGRSACAASVRDWARITPGTRAFSDCWLPSVHRPRGE